MKTFQFTTICFIWLSTVEAVELPTDDVATCTLCPAGEPPPKSGMELDTATSTLWGSRTCGDLAVNEKFINQYAWLCPISQENIGVRMCGCDEFLTSECSLCPAESLTFNGNASLDIETATQWGVETCGELATNFEFLSQKGILCLRNQLSVGTIQCGCATSTENILDGDCTICFDESSPDNSGGFFDFFGQDKEDVSCDENDDDSVFKFLPRDSALCRAVQVRGALSCSCPPPANGCSLCFDSLDIPGDLDNLIFDFLGGGDGRNCRDVFNLAPLIPGESEMCKYIQALAFLDCACVSLPPFNLSSPPAACSICEDITQQADRGNTIPGTNLTCGDVFDASKFFMDDQDCREDFSVACCNTEQTASPSSPGPTPMPTVTTTMSTHTIIGIKLFNVLSRTMNDEEIMIFEEAVERFLDGLNTTKFGIEIFSAHVISQMMEVIQRNGEGNRRHKMLRQLFSESDGKFTNLVATNVTGYCSTEEICDGGLLGVLLKENSEELKQMLLEVDETLTYYFAQIDGVSIESEEATPTSPDDDDGVEPWVIILIILLVVIAILLLVVMIKRRSNNVNRKPCNDEAVNKDQAKEDQEDEEKEEEEEDDEEVSTNGEQQELRKQESSGLEPQDTPTTKGYGGGFGGQSQKSIFEDDEFFYERGPGVTDGSLSDSAMATVRTASE